MSRGPGCRDPTGDGTPGKGGGFVLEMSAHIIQRTCRWPHLEEFEIERVVAFWRRLTELVCSKEEAQELEQRGMKERIVYILKSEFFVLRCNISWPASTGTDVDVE